MDGWMNGWMEYKDIVELDTKTMLLSGSPRDILRKAQGVNRKGIDIRLYTVDSGRHARDSKDIQTVTKFLLSRHNPDPKYQKTREDLDKLLSEQLDNIIISDRAKSCSDFYKVTDKVNIARSNSLVIWDSQKMKN
jgi:hypothetical protein